MSDFFVYDKNSGAILRSGYCPISMVYLQAIQPNEEFEIGKADGLTEYYDKANAEKKLKLSNPTSRDKTEILANGLDRISFFNIPTNSEIFLNFQSLGICDDGLFEFSSDVVGLHTITVKKVEFLDYQVTINAL